MPTGNSLITMGVGLRELLINLPSTSSGEVSLTSLW